LPIKRGVATIDARLDPSYEFHNTFAEAQEYFAGLKIPEHKGIYAFSDEDNLYVFRGTGMLADNRIAGEVAPFLGELTKRMKVPAHGHLCGGVSIYDVTKWNAKVNYGVLDSKIRNYIQSLRDQK
jgi:hypothetical protein